MSADPSTPPADPFTPVAVPPPPPRRLPPRRLPRPPSTALEDLFLEADDDTANVSSWWGTTAAAPIVIDSSDSSSENDDEGTEVMPPPLPQRPSLRLPPPPPPPPPAKGSPLLTRKRRSGALLTFQDGEAPAAAAAAAAASEGIRDAPLIRRRVLETDETLALTVRPAAAAAGLPEPKIIGKGTYGCVVDPPLICEGDAAPRSFPGHPHVVGKLLTSNWGDPGTKQMNDQEIQILEYLRDTIDPAARFHVPMLMVCKLDAQRVVRQISDWKACAPLVQAGGMETQIIMENGGILVREWVASLSGLPAREAVLKLLKAAESLFRGIQTLSDYGLMHNDMQDRNIMYNPATKTLRLIDWGIAMYFQSYQRLSNQAPNWADYDSDVYYEPVFKAYSISPPERDYVKVLGKYVADPTTVDAATLHRYQNEITTNMRMLKRDVPTGRLWGPSALDALLDPGITMPQFLEGVTRLNSSTTAFAQNQYGLAAGLAYIMLPFLKEPAVTPSFLKVMRRMLDPDPAARYPNSESILWDIGLAFPVSI